jgi:hypothetical protein
MMRVNLRTMTCVVALVAICGLAAQGQVNDNGTCTPVSQGLNFRGTGGWDLWSCVPDDPFLYDRIDIAVGKDDQLFHLAGAIFVCGGGQKVTAVFKDHKKDIGLPPYPHHEVWGASFSPDCKGPVDAYLLPGAPSVDPHPFIKAVEFNLTTPKAIPTVSEWGIMIMALLLVIGAKVYFTRRRAAQA